MIKLIICVSMLFIVDFVGSYPSVVPTSCTQQSSQGYWCTEDSDVISSPYYYYCNGKSGSWKSCPCIIT